MRFALEGIQEEIASAARTFLSTEWDLNRLRGLDGAFPEDVWQQLAELGWFTLLLDENRGGLGLGAVEAASVFEEAGRQVLPGPLFANIVAGAFCDVSSEGLVTLATLSAGDDAELSGGLLTARFGLVDSVDAATTIIAVVPCEHGKAVVSIPAAETTWRRVASIDFARRPFEVIVDRTSVNVLAAGGEADAIYDRLTDWGLVMNAARVLGLIDRMLELSVLYAQQREQFGRPIGSFQAIQHRLADLAVLAVVGRSVAYVAQWALASGASDAPHKARVAAGYLGRAVRRVAEGAIQVHGGVGFTEEHDLHLLVKHSLTLEGAWGGPGAHEDAVAGALLARRQSEGGAWD